MSVKYNGKDIKQSEFPNGESDYIPVYACGFRSKSVFEVVFESNKDLFDLIVYKKAWDDQFGIDANSVLKSELHIKFFPYGQMDRQLENHLFSLKYVAEIINDLKFDNVYICDPHSNVTPALLKHCTVVYPCVNFVFNNDENYDLYFFPDVGAYKKYTEVLGAMTKLPYRFGNKRRNLDTGEIICYDIVADKKDIDGKRILIIDDLCMGGRTFVEAAKALKSLGAKSVDLFVTHLMPQAKSFYETKGNGLIDNIHTEDTLNQIKKWSNINLQLN